MCSLWNRLKFFLKSDYIWWTLISLGVIFRLQQYIANRSLWHDEANLALNIINRTFAELLQPLDYDQGAPIGFLLITKTFTLLFGNEDYILRLIPILSGLLATYLAYRLAKEYLGVGGYLFLLIFATSWSLVYYASDLKQYASDVMAVVLLIYLAFRSLGEDAKKKDIIMLAVVGFFLIWISHPGAFVAAGIGLVLALEKFIKKSYTRLSWMLGMGVVWIVSFGSTYLISLRSLAADESLKHYWRNAFMPIPPWKDWGWFIKTYTSLLQSTSWGLDSEKLLWLSTALIIIGVISYFFKDWYKALIIIVPVSIVSLASAMQIYPIRGRLALFLIPIIILLLAEGAGRIYIFINQWNHNAAIITYFALVLFIAWTPVNGAIDNFLSPRLGAHIKPVLTYVSENRNEDDIVYIYHGARPSFNYYAPFYGLEGESIITGLDLGNTQALTQFYKHVNNKLNGHSRVWVIFSHIVDCGGCEGDMETFYVEYLNQYGSIEEQYNVEGASVYRYDFSAP